MIEFLTEEKSFNPMTRDNLVLVDFYADWCEPCKWLDEILVVMDKKLPENVKILKVNIEAFPALQAAFEIRGIPVLMLFKEGEMVWRMNGFLAGDELLAMILSHWK